MTGVYKNLVIYFMREAVVDKTPEEGIAIMSGLDKALRTLEVHGVYLSANWFDNSENRVRLDQAAGELSVNVKKAILDAFDRIAARPVPAPMY